MNKVMTVLSLGLGAMAAAHGQSGGPHDGQWTARFEAFGQARQARIEIQGQGGSWQTMYLPQGADVCLRLKVPIEVLAVTPQEITFVTRRSQALAGCTDGNPVTFKRTGENALEGVFANGTPVRLER